MDKREDLSYLWSLSGEARIQAFEEAYRTFGQRMFAFPSFFKTTHLAQKYTTLLDAPLFNQRPKTIRTIAFYFFTYSIGGVERCISYLIPLFQSLGYKVIFITDNDSSTDAYPLPEGVTRLVFGEANNRLQPFELLQNRCVLWQELIQTYHIDAVYYAYSSNAVRLLDFPAIRASGAYLMYHFHIQFSHHLLTQNANVFHDFTSLIRLSDALVCLSRVDERFFKLCQCRAQYIPNKCFFDQMPRKTARLKPSSFNCLWCGRFAPQKQPLEIIPLFAEIRKTIPQATLTLLGEETPTFKCLNYKAQMLQQAKLLGCNEAIEWAGYQKDVRPYYEHADVLISTSQCEGFALVFIEAYAYGLPIVSYEMAYLEPLQDEIAATCVPQGDQKAAARAVIQLFSSPQKYQAASLAALNVATQFMSFDQATAWKQVIETLPQPFRPHETPQDMIDRKLLETLLSHGAYSYQRTEDLLITAQKKVKKMRKSFTWKIGRIFTALPEKLITGIKRIRM